MSTDTNRGSAYIFTKPPGCWVNTTQVAKLTASDGAASDRLGWSVSISGDTVLSGANGDTIGMNDDQGSAYVFVKQVGGWADTTETAKLTATDGEAGDLLGCSAAITGDTVVLGAYGDAIGSNNQQGSVYVFVKPDGEWVNTTQTAKLTASEGAELDWFGWSVSLSGETVITGAFADAIGANNLQGSAYVFEKPDGGWADMNETTKLTASDGTAGDGFGWSVGISGNTLVAGAYTDTTDSNTNQGSAYVFYHDTRSRIYLPLIAR